MVLILFFRGTENYQGGRGQGARGWRGNALKYFEKQKPKMLPDLHLAYVETAGPTEKRKFALGLKN